MDAILIYVTVKDKPHAATLARALLEARLIACANLLDGATSLYRWEGKLQEESECVLIAKTTRARLEAVTAKVKELHDYACPCIVALPILGGNTEFLQWVVDEVSDFND